MGEGGAEKRPASQAPVKTGELRAVGGSEAPGWWSEPRKAAIQLLSPAEWFEGVAVFSSMGAGGCRPDAGLFMPAAPRAAPLRPPLAPFATKLASEAGVAIESSVVAGEVPD